YAPMIFRIARYEDKATYQSHYLGLAWQVLNPLIQIAIYYFVFGFAFNSSSGSNASYIEWMLAGIIPWFFISGVILQGANSIYNKINMVSKMNFPMSILPSINIASNLTSYFTMMVLLVGLFAVKGTPITIYWGQYLYYFVAMIAFLYSFTLLNATISVLVRDYYIMLQSLIRVLFYMSGVVWDLQTKLPEWAFNILKLNPIYYLINGFRETFLMEKMFWENPSYTVYFWLLTGVLLFVGASLHMKFRERFVDYL
ncbi:TPA: ABC transporter permease, partial [Listeria monocytogenes]|nr:ABC transporter permease [Listeria monocytogenes]EAE2775225.1 ABC transporter permease [Listeria monocytogenes]EAF3762567.1 ABC transporter permease [Listeria monocytogenes]EBD1619408.1 ABC transporter permease [Listeria monocytogenes]EDN8615464.1 ABC transporter permease [Listeria monocytogenes]